MAPIIGVTCIVLAAYGIWWLRFQSDRRALHHATTPEERETAEARLYDSKRRDVLRLVILTAVTIAAVGGVVAAIGSVVRHV
jgi:hypothetical protein